jgi:chloramphenicol 3-O-phosphotransferase
MTPMESNERASHGEVVSLREYLVVLINEKHAYAVGLIKEKTDFSVGLLREADLRHEQRFRGQNEAVTTALASAEKAVNAALAAADRAVLKAEGASDKRFDSVNEFRSSLNDMVRDLLPRKEADQRFTGITEKLDEVMRRQDKSEGTGGGLKAGWGYLVAGIITIATIINMAISLKGVK